MTDTTLDYTMVGQTIMSDGTLTSVTFSKPPQSPGWCFTLVDVDASGIENELFNIPTWAMAVPTGTVFPMYGHPFTNLVLKSISPEGAFTITTTP